jgi:ABC-type transport system involved in cytochrome c biogenesis ATPase subunit
MSISRQGGWSGNSHSGRAWQVLIDGSVATSISNNETVDLPVAAGHHAAQVTSMRFLRSPKVSLEVAEGQVIRLSCRKRARHPFIVQRSIIYLLASLFKHDLWISLTPDDTVETDLEAGGDDSGLRAGAPAASRSPASVRTITSVREITSAPTLDGKRGAAALAVHQLTKRFGQRTAFSEVSFEVAYGEVFGFLGPNGAGKTTTVRTLGTLIAPTSGSATVAGIPLSPENEVEIRQRIAIMPEAPGLYLRLTVTENLEYFAGLYGLHNPGPRIEKALEAVSLANRAGDLCGGLSKGLRQRRCQVSHARPRAKASMMSRGAQAPGGSRRSQLPKCRWQTTRRMSLGWRDFARTQLRALGHPRSSSYGITAGVRRLGHRHCASVFIAARGGIISAPEVVRVSS